MASGAREAPCYTLAWMVLRERLQILKVKKLGRSYTHTHTPLCGPHLPCQEMTHRVQDVYAVRVALRARTLAVTAGPNKERCTCYQLLAFCR